LADVSWDVRPEKQKTADAQRLRAKAAEMLRLAKQSTMPEVAEELIEMARLLHESAQKTEAAIASSPPPPSQRSEKIGWS